jgi:hypothetical protein
MARHCGTVHDLAYKILPWVKLPFQGLNVKLFAGKICESISHELTRSSFAIAAMCYMVALKVK